MKLYGYFRSSTTYRLRIALELKAIEYEYIPVNLLESEQNDAGFTTRNPFGTVPMLVADGRDRAQSMAQLAWLGGAQLADGTRDLLPQPVVQCRPGSALVSYQCVIQAVIFRPRHRQGGNTLRGIFILLRPTPNYRICYT